jgi:hypothetical protein
MRDALGPEENHIVRTITCVRSLSAAAAFVLLAGCSSGPATAPMSGAIRDGVHSRSDGTLAGYDSCPATGTIVYVSDYWHGVINVFHGNFRSQPPCGQITSGLSLPYGMYVDPTSHDLYVANTGDDDVLVFHKGQTAPYNTYTDPTIQTFPVDVTVAPDGTVLASNLGETTGDGSISTWIGGPNGGTFVGHFPMTNDIMGAFITVDKHGTVYYDDRDRTSTHGAIWSLQCPAGACGTQSRVAGVTLKDPGGIIVDSTNDLFAEDPDAHRGEIFELPNPNATMFKTLTGSPDGIGIDEKQHHWFTGDFGIEASEYSYPSGVLIGSVRGANGGSLRAVAVDP